MKFYGYFRSSAAYRCRIAFNLKGFKPELSPVHLTKDGGQQQSDWYRAINPQSLVPTLEVAEGVVLTQSLAIIEWLEETIPTPPLLPNNPVERAKVRAVAQLVACDIHPLQNLRVLKYLRSQYRQDQSRVDRWCQRWLADGLQACEILLLGAGEHDFCFGRSPGLADICLVPQLFSADRFGVDLTAMPRIRAIRKACDAHPAFSMAHPSVQPDAES
jgi:maleylacetoacetate isomerase